MKHCDGKTQGGRTCSTKPFATVTYFTDGSGSKVTCRQHLAQAMDAVAEDINRPDGGVTLSVYVHVKTT